MLRKTICINLYDTKQSDGEIAAWALGNVEYLFPCYHSPVQSDQSGSTW